MNMERDLASLKTRLEQYENVKFQQLDSHRYQSAIPNTTDLHDQLHDLIITVEGMVWREDQDDTTVY